MPEGLAEVPQFLIGGNGGNEGKASAINGHLWMKPGDTLAMDDQNFVAGDGMTKIFIFEEYVI